MKKSLILLSILLFSNKIIAQEITQGTWFNEEKDGKIQVYKQGDKYFGKLIWLKEPNDKDGKPMLDKFNPDNKQKSKPILGMILLKNLKFNGKNVWEEGEIYDPKNGKTYSCKMTLNNPKQLDLRGYIGFSLIGRTTHWTKAE